MKILAAANQKGGVGKTAAAVHLAYYMAEQGLKVLFADLDPQANASYTLEEYASGVPASELFSRDDVELKPGPKGITLIAADVELAGLESMSLADAANNFADNVERIGVGFDVCVLDTAPALGVKMAAALLSADFILAPIELEAYSLQGINHMIQTIEGVRENNPDLEFLGMVASKVDRRNPRHVRHQDELTEAFGELLIPTPIGLRNSVADALDIGVPVWKIRKTAARAAGREMKSLSEFVVKRMGLLNE